MKNIIMAALAALIVGTAASAPIADGYYRVQNYLSKRYIYVIDNRGGLNYGTTSADVHAITLWSGLDRTISDPASIIYSKQVDANAYDFAAQGTSVEQLIGMPAQVYAGTDNRYMIYGTKDGLAKYLGDGEKGDIEQGYMTDNARGDERYWTFYPVQTNGNNYFGVKPEVQAQGKYYATMMASWPFSTASTGMEVLIVKNLDAVHGVAVVGNAGNAIEGGTPVLFRMTGSTPSVNRLNVGASGTKPEGNFLSGTYFDFDAAEPNHVVYDANTMRVLGVTGDGKPAFVTDNSLKTIPANHCWLNVPANSPANYLIMTQEEYIAYLESLVIDVTGITLDRTEAQIVEGETLKLQATVTPANATDKTVSWSSSNTQIATVDDNGLVRALVPGKARITARAGNFTASCEITVKKRIIDVTSVTVEPAEVSVTEGDTFVLTATVLPENATDKTVHWSSNSSCVTIDGSGHGVAVAPGEAVITVSAGQCQATAVVTVAKKIIPVTSLSLDKTSMEMVEGETQVIVATVGPENATDKTITWTSSNLQVATVGTDGSVKGVAPGEAVITASCGGFEATCKVTVKKKEIPVTSVTVTPREIELTAGDNYQLSASYLPANATITGVAWTSTNVAIATVSQHGLVTAVGAGSCEITALAGECSDKCVVTVKAKEIPVETISITPSSANLTEGETIQLSATITPENHTDQLSWSTSDAQVCTVTDDGLVTAVKAGRAEVSLSSTLEPVKKATCAVLVLPESGIIAVVNDTNSFIKVDGLNISISGNQEPASVYLPSGILVAVVNPGKSFTLPSAGLYIVKIANEVIKIVL